MTLPLADHARVTAIPFVIPALLIFVGIGIIAFRDRRNRGRNA
jgi:hypothetical protein